MRGRPPLRTLPPSTWQPWRTRVCSAPVDPPWPRPQGPFRHPHSLCGSMCRRLSECRVQGAHCPSTRGRGRGLCSALLSAERSLACGYANNDVVSWPGHPTPTPQYGRTGLQHQGGQAGAASERGRHRGRGSSCSAPPSTVRCSPVGVAIPTLHTAPLDWFPIFQSKCHSSAVLISQHKL
jgi:hypothetical protein